ncbi:relaxase/mobilization nuclease domain-containing protein [Klebsiella pneumoniae]|uniref:relaxase/mobilization nuclease domain-containing protein n=1 Tax=Klebsiella pneumoniae TaxID=573 RepID=UPI003A520FF2
MFSHGLDYEKPNDDQVFDSVKFTLASMGMSDHQYVAAIHRDTDKPACACCC